MMIEAIYQNGLIKPTHPLNLPNNLRLRIDIMPFPTQQKRTLAKYKGVFLARGGNFNFEAIEQTLNEAKANHLNSLLGELA